MTKSFYSIENMLYDLLPEYYRDQDRVGEEGSAEDRPLQKYLGALGSVLDRTRYTLEQQYHDSFADDCQEWILSYLADLLGVELQSPYAAGQRNEIRHAVRWSQSRGTLGAVEQIVEGLTQSEGALVEGWKRVITTARLDMPLLPATAIGEPQPAHPDKNALGGPAGPSEISTHPNLHQITPRMSQHMRAVQAPMGTPTAQRWMGNQYSQFWPMDDEDPWVSDVPANTPIYWRILYPQGAPCFPDSYQDKSLRTPVMSSSRQITQPYHPRLLGVYLPKFGGFTPEGALRFPWSADLSGTSSDGPGTLADYISLETQGDKTVIRNHTAHCIIIEGNITWNDGNTVRFEKLCFKDNIQLDSGRIEFERCAINSVYSSVNETNLSNPVPLIFKDCLVGQIRADNHRVQCEYVTVIGQVKVKSLLASDSIFADISGLGLKDCLRFCRVPESYFSASAPISRNASMTTAVPSFLRVDRPSRWQLAIDQQNRSASGFTANVAVANAMSNPTMASQILPTQPFAAGATILDFSVIGLGTLNDSDDDSLRFGAEDGGELGAFHAFRYAAQDQAIKRKLKDSLPVGISPIIIRDKTLECPPAILSQTPGE